MRKQLPMTGWYDPGMLVQTGIRVAISTVFGQFVDRRESIAAANAVAAQPFDPSFDYSKKSTDGAFWLDFMADTGDGWDSTFAMAQLVTEPNLRFGDDDLPRGRVLVLGGDEVYPTPSREAYEDRFLGPFDQAFENLGEAPPPMPDLYVMPGNHDWYDGLNSFFELFCRRRMTSSGSIGVPRDGSVIAGRKTLQSRSYFALKLPGGWWLWGTDSQLEGHIDQPQIEYFQWVASHWMEPRSKLILCVGQPHWAYVDNADPKPQFRTMSYVERLAGIARNPKDAPKLMGHELKLVLAGDSHHYARHESASVQYVTCGGGGAFLHPTHHLEDKSFQWKYPPPGVAHDPDQPPQTRRFDIAVAADGRPALFPDPATSRRLTRGNFGFAFLNPGMTLVYFGAYLVFNWLLEVNARTTGHGSLLAAIGGGGFPEALCAYAKLLFASPWSFILMGSAYGGYYYLAGEPNGPQRVLIGAAHWIAQTLTAVLLTCAMALLVGHIWPQDLLFSGSSNVGAIVLGSALAAVGSATVLGLYFLISLNLFGRHWNEAFSALAIKDFKCFLRMSIDADGALRVYPIGLTRTPKAGGSRPGSGEPDALRPHLIEGPLVIR
ncbi:metallophosphoesterase [Methylopila sp. M107]|uniref:metallophosphoesterase family protein n=1 Tax=Methylopila sp. M107 TaxID=1101190 RepID=UPI0018C9B352|nr:metallophosphoesterase [Methylopila sp. M107]